MGLKREKYTPIKLRVSSKEVWQGVEEIIIKEVTTLYNQKL
jgi:hypothetical protein